jgi:MMP 1-O-methyltransferase
MDDRLRSLALETIGFMPEKEGLALYRAARDVAHLGPVLEVGSYCGRSTIFLAAGVRDAGGSVVYSVDHHRGSEEHQPGEEYHDERLVDAAGNVDTLSAFRATMARAALDDTVVPIVASSPVVAKGWSTPLGLAFIDGGHSTQAATTDYESWAPHVRAGGSLAIHDVFPDPAEGGRPPFEIYQSALEDGRFAEIAAEGSLRVLRRLA